METYQHNDNNNMLQQAFLNDVHLEYLCNDFEERSIIGAICKW